MRPALQLPLQQHPDFAAALHLIGRRCHAIGLVGAAPVQTIVRFGMRFASRGPIWLNSPAAPDPETLRQAGLHLINSDGGDASVIEDAGYRMIAQPAQVAELSLAGTSEERLMRLNGKWRNALRRARKSPIYIQCEKYRPERHSWLLKADLRQQREKGFRALPHHLLNAYAHANPDKSLVLVAYSNGEPIAAMVFLVHGAVATYYLGWTSSDGRKHAAHHAILMHAGDFLSTRSVVRIDLGTMNRALAPGLARFKIGTGANSRSLGGTWLRLPRLRYQEYPLPKARDAA
jgi:lipid II:glycine glycyltransferase (peptidoglycan interpeptide bridge formation enzyme)